MSQAQSSGRRSGGSSTLLGELMKRKRVECAMSQQVAADKLGISRENLSQIEHGVIRQPSPIVLTKTVELFGIPASDLFAAAGYSLPKDLPNLRPYLCAKHPEWPNAAVLEIEEYCAYVRYKYGLPE